MDEETEVQKGYVEGQVVGLEMPKSVLQEAERSLDHDSFIVHLLYDARQVLSLINSSFPIFKIRGGTSWFLRGLQLCSAAHNIDE